MKRFFLQLTLLATTLLCSGGISYAQESEPYTQSVIDKFVNYYKDGIDEKLYLQTDKPYYSAGENIWIKGYLLNTITHAPLRVTNFIYAELIDSSNKLVERVKIQRDSTGFNGYIAINSDLPAADYTLRGYTRWMTNKSEDFYFHKSVKIVSPIPDDAKAERSGETIVAEAKPSAEEAVTVEAKALDFDVQFFPEGGALMPGAPQRVAFKALAEDGLSTEIVGEILDPSGKSVASIKSIHKGMGVVQLFPEAGKSYTANIQAADGTTKEFNLPTVATQAAVIKVQRMGEKVFYQASATSNSLLAGAHVVVHSRGKILTVDNGTQPATRYITADRLYDGISVFSLVDRSGQVISERIFFKRPTTLPTLSLTPNAENYPARTRATINMAVTDSKGEPAKGEFAVSVTDDSAIELDSAQENVLSYLLLSSEIKGNIEDPGLYFTQAPAAADLNLDILMMTQGWRRFELQDILNNIMPQYTESFEDVAKISGRVRGYFGNAARRPKLFVICSQTNFTDIFSLDESSRFNLLGLNIPDSATYVIQSQGRNGGSSLKLIIDEERFPSIGKKSLVQRDRTVVPFNFINQSQEKFYYEGGLTNIDIDAVSVTTKKPEEVRGVVGASFSTSGTSRAELDEMNGVRLEELMFGYPSMIIESDSVYYRGNTTPVRFMVDGIEDDYGNLTYLTSDEIERLDFFSGADAAIFSDASGGVMCITLREGVTLKSGTQSPNIAYVSQLGYQRKMEFFQPKYSSPSVKANWPPDFRTTVYWNGTLLSDESGDVSFDFYTADKSTTYTITVEGVTESGEICRGTRTIERSLAR